MINLRSFQFQHQCFTEYIFESILCRSPAPKWRAFRIKIESKKDYPLPQKALLGFNFELDILTSAFSGKIGLISSVYFRWDYGSFRFDEI